MPRFSFSLIGTGGASFGDDQREGVGREKKSFALIRDADTTTTPVCLRSFARSK